MLRFQREFPFEVTALPAVEEARMELWLIQYERQTTRHLAAQVLLLQGPVNTKAELVPEGQVESSPAIYRRVWEKERSASQRDA